jgi:hypothetical protein
MLPHELNKYKLTEEDKTCLNEWLREVSQNNNKKVKQKDYIDVVVEWLNDVTNK